MNKKLFLLFAILLLCIFVSAEDQNATVNYHVDSSFIWEIHSTIDFGHDAGTGQTINRTAQIGQNNVGVQVTKNVIPDGKVLVISIDANQVFTIANQNVSLNYTVSKTENGEALSASDSVLEVACGTNTGNQALYFKLNTGNRDAEIAGTYTGTITYVANLRNPAPPVNQLSVTYMVDDEVVKVEHYDENSQIYLSELTAFTGISTYASAEDYSFDLYDINTQEKVETTDNNGVDVYSTYKEVLEWEDSSTYNVYSVNDPFTLTEDTVFNCVSSNDYSEFSGVLVVLSPSYICYDYTTRTNYIEDYYGNKYYNGSLYSIRVTNVSEIDNERTDNADVTAFPAITSVNLDLPNHKVVYADIIN